MSAVVEFEEFPLKCGEATYHVIPSEKVGVGVVTRFNGYVEAAFIRHNGAWLPALFPTPMGPSPIPSTDLGS